MSKLAHITKEDAASVGIKEGDYPWGEQLKPLLVAQGIPAEKLYQGSMEVTGVWDGKGGLYIADEPGNGIRIYGNNTGERDEYIKELKRKHNG